MAPKLSPDAELVKLSVRKLRAVFDPWGDCPWRGCVRAPTVKLVRAAIKAGAMLEPKRSTWPDMPTHKHHVQRVAWLVVNGWDVPIWVNADSKRNIVQDGKHRFAAAILRGDKSIMAMASGSALPSFVWRSKGADRAKS